VSPKEREEGRIRPRRSKIALKLAPAGKWNRDLVEHCIVPAYTSLLLAIKDKNESLFCTCWPNIEKKYDNTLLRAAKSREIDRDEKEKERESTANRNDVG